MPQNPKTLTILLLFVSTLATRGDRALGAVPRVSIGMDAVVNTLDGSARSECEAQDDVESGSKHKAWVSFGSVKPQREKGWEMVASGTRCGDGPFDKASKMLGRVLGIPYILVIVETIPSVRPGGKLGLETRLEIRKLSSFDVNLQPVYTLSEQKRSFDLGIGEEAIIPILVADQSERDAFNVNELFLQLRAQVLGRGVEGYGTISVEVDIPGVELLLDGGLVGRTIEGGPTVLSNVPVGKHAIKVRDLSGRAAWKGVVVEEGRTVQVALKLLNLPSSGRLPNLVSIGKNPQGYKEYWRPRDGAVVVRVPAGEFLMGSAEVEGEPSERPQRRVFVTEFLMDKTEVTWRQFRAFVEATGAKLPPEPLWGTPNEYAVSGVRFDEAKAYCDWVGGRLPTEAEWEKAARGTDGRNYPWGKDWDPYRCNSWVGGPHRPEAVGSFPDCVSPYGILDMAGGLLEWCADWYAAGYPEDDSQDPKGPDTGRRRVLRGGSWLYQPKWVRTAYRHKNDPSSRNVHHGFRCVQSATQ